MYVQLKNGQFFNRKDKNFHLRCQLELYNVLVAKKLNCWMDISSLNQFNSTSCMKSMCHADEDEIIYQCILKGRKAIYLVSCDFIPFTRFFHNFFYKKETIIVKQILEKRAIQFCSKQNFRKAPSQIFDENFVHWTILRKWPSLQKYH